MHLINVFIFYVTLDNVAKNVDITDIKTRFIFGRSMTEPSLSQVGSILMDLKDIVTFTIFIYEDMTFRSK